MKYEKMLLQQTNPGLTSALKSLLDLLDDDSLNVSCDQLLALVFSNLSLAGNCQGHSNDVFNTVRLFDQLKKYPTHNSTNEKSVRSEDAELLSSMTYDRQKFVNMVSKISTTRQQLSEFSKLFFVEDTIPQYRPLLQQIADAVFQNDPSRSLNDLHYCSASSIKGLIKSGFSYFMPVSKPRPAECTTVIFFVIGGISPAEVKLVKESASRYNSQCNLYIGSNRLSGHPRQTIESLIDAL